MITEQRLRNYAELVVTQGTNVQKGQLIVIDCPVDHAKFGRYCAEAAYKAGASQVLMQYQDDLVRKMDYDYAATEVLKKYPLPV